MKRTGFAIPLLVCLIFLHYLENKKQRNVREGGRRSKNAI